MKQEYKPGNVRHKTNCRQLYIVLNSAINFPIIFITFTIKLRNIKPYEHWKYKIVITIITYKENKNNQGCKFMFSTLGPHTKINQNLFHNFRD